MERIKVRKKLETCKVKKENKLCTFLLENWWTVSLILPILETAGSCRVVPTSSLRHDGEGQSEQICPCCLPGYQGCFQLWRSGCCSTNDSLHWPQLCSARPTAQSWLRMGNLSLTWKPSPSSRSEVPPTQNGMMLVPNMLWNLLVSSPPQRLSRPSRKGGIKGPSSLPSCWCFQWLWTTEMWQLTQECQQCLLYYQRLSPLPRSSMTIPSSSRDLRPQSMLPLTPRRLWTVSLGNSGVVAMSLPRISSLCLSTSATKALGKITPKLNKKLIGMAFYVPIPNVSIMEKAAKNGNIEKVVKQALAERGILNGILDYTEDQAVSWSFKQWHPLFCLWYQDWHCSQWPPCQVHFLAWQQIWLPEWCVSWHTWLPRSKIPWVTMQEWQEERGPRLPAEESQFQVSP